MDTIFHRINYQSDHTLIECLDHNQQQIKQEEEHNVGNQGKKLVPLSDHSPVINTCGCVSYGARLFNAFGVRARPFLATRSSNTTSIDESIIPNMNLNRTLTRNNLNVAGEKGRVCFTIDGVLSPEECRKIIARSEDVGFKPALVNVGRGAEIEDSDTRKSDRCIIDDIDFSQEIFQRIQHCFPKECSNGTLYEYGLKMHGLNERMRILRYQEGEYFRPHSDGSYRPNKQHASIQTMMIYLNSGGGVNFEGGCTVFHGRKCSRKSTSTEHVPKTGSVLIFDHPMVHEGAELLRGTKYAIRTDVMYKI